MDGDYTAREVAQLLEDPDVQLVDVREPDEHEAGRIAGSTLIPLGELSERAQSLDPVRPIVFYCRSGSRSAMAAQAFRGAGFDAHNLDGGLLEWVADGLPLEPEGAYVA
jgi:rhodanese-related sulfurtransferase